MPEFDIVLKDGIVVDGTQSQRYRADVGIARGRIARIGRLRGSDATRVLDASGQIVAPGFIDLHTHYDAQLFWDPYLTLSGWHGVTSVVIGNCGFGFAPMRPELRERAMLTMTRVEAIPFESMRRGLPWDWVTYPEFLDSVDRAAKAVNVLPYVPVAPLLVWVLGFDRAKAGDRPTPAEHRELRRLLHDAMDAGGCGWSAQRLHPDGPGAVQRDYDGGPMVTDVMHDETALELAEVLAERNQGFM
jgi:N-acyl-D-aspartate/D-glutamate deacylase